MASTIRAREGRGHAPPCVSLVPTASLQVFSIVSAASGSARRCRYGDVTAPRSEQPVLADAAPPSFSNLIERARTGDKGALGEVFRAHHHLLLRYFRGCEARSPEDLASQVWIEVAAGLVRFRGDDIGFRRWLFTIARRRYIDSVRRDVRRPEQPHPDIPALSAADGAGDEAFDATASLERALALVRVLPRDMADAVMLRVIADLDVADVASIMATSEGNVRVLVHRGLARLRSKLVVTQPAPASIYGEE